MKFRAVAVKRSCLVLSLALTACVGSGAVAAKPVPTDLAGQAALVAGDGDDATRGKAAAALLDQEAVRGRYIGVDALMITLRELDEPRRAALMGALVEGIERGLTTSDEARSYHYKDAGYLLLVDDEVVGKPLLGDAALRDSLSQALLAWAVGYFPTRAWYKGQRYDMTRLFQVLGTDAAAQVVPLIKGSREEAVAVLVAVGDAAARAKAAEFLVQLADEIAADQWRSAHLGQLLDANQRAGRSPTAEQIELQLRDEQTDALLGVLGSMRKFGGPAVVAYCSALAKDTAHPTRWRAGALSALQGHLTADNAAELFAIVNHDKTPASVMREAFRRLGELPRGTVASGLYALFGASDWRVRRLAAATLLKSSKVEHIDEFMAELASRVTGSFGIAEAITYGARLGELAGGDVRAALEKHMSSGAAPVRMSALAFEYSHGGQARIDGVASFEADPQPLAPCQGARCPHACVVAGEPKEVATIGDFARLCVRPRLERAALAARPVTAPEGDAPAGNASAVVAAMRGRFRGCYNTGVAVDRALAGSVTLNATLGASGEVIAVDASTGDGLDAIVPCLTAVVRAGVFAAPDEGRSRIISIPVTFVSQ